MAVGGREPHGTGGREPHETGGREPREAAEDAWSGPPERVDGPDPVDGPEPVDGPQPVGRAPAVRPFLLTAGRVSGADTAAPLPIETQIVSTSAGLSVLGALAFERHDIVAACRRPQSVAELAARLRLHLNVVRVLAEDLCAAGHLAVHVPHARIAQDISVLRRVINGLRAVPDSRGTLRDSG